MLGLAWPAASSRGLSVHGATRRWVCIRSPRPSSRPRAVHMWQSGPGSQSRRESVSRAFPAAQGPGARRCDQRLHVPAAGARHGPPPWDMQALDTSPRTQPVGCREARCTDIRQIGLPGPRLPRVHHLHGRERVRGGPPPTAASPDGRTSRGSRLQARPARALLWGTASSERTEEKILWGDEKQGELRTGN